MDNEPELCTPDNKVKSRIESLVAEIAEHKQMHSHIADTLYNSMCEKVYTGKAAPRQLIKFSDLLSRLFYSDRTNVEPENTYLYEILIQDSRFDYFMGDNNMPYFFLTEWKEFVAD